MSEVKYQEIGNRLKYVRNIHVGVTQEVMAEKLGISVEFYRMLESGRSLPNLNVLGMLHEVYQDIDYILIGRSAQKSVFEEIIGPKDEIRRENICNLLVYKMKELQIDSKKECDEHLYAPDFVMLLHKMADMELTPYNRIMEVIFFSRIADIPYGRFDKQKISNDAIAEDLNKSYRTASRLAGGKSALKTDMVLAVCEKYDFSPSYILFGKINSNSLVDRYYEQMLPKDKELVMEFARVLTHYI